MDDYTDNTELIRRIIVATGNLVALVNRLEAKHFGSEEMDVAELRRACQCVTRCPCMMQVCQRCATNALNGEAPAEECRTAYAIVHTNIPELPSGTVSEHECDEIKRRITEVRPDIAVFDEYDYGNNREGLVCLDGQRMRFSNRPYRLIYHVLSNGGDVGSPEECVEAVWAHSPKKKEYLTAIAEYQAGEIDASEFHHVMTNYRSTFSKMNSRFEKANVQCRFRTPGLSGTTLWPEPTYVLINRI